MSEQANHDKLHLMYGLQQQQHCGNFGSLCHMVSCSLEACRPQATGPLCRYAHSR